MSNSPGAGVPAIYPEIKTLGDLGLLPTKDQTTFLSALASKDEILSAANAGASSAWVPYVAGMRLAYALDSGSTSTQFSVDISADGITSLGQAFTGSWASSSVAEITPPLYLTNPQVAFIRFNVISGGPLSVKRNV